MSIKFREITRGSGKIYIHVTMTTPAAGTPSVSSHLASGDEVPSEVIKLTDVEGHVVVLPVLQVAQTVTFSLLDGKGTTVERASQTISFEDAKLKSRINTFTKNRVASQIRNADARPGMESTRIEVTDILPNDGNNIVRGVITSDIFSQQDATKTFDVRVLGPSGRDASLRPWVNMGDKVHSEPTTVSGIVRKTNFSLLIPQDVPSFVVWVTSDSPDGPSGFLCCEDFFVADKRRQGEDLFRDTEFDPRYDGWFRDLHRTCKNELARQNWRDFHYQPLFSLVIPFGSGESPQATVESALAQTYGQLEVVLVGPEDAEPTVSDNRAHFMRRNETMTERDAAEAGIRAAAGDFVCFARPGDLLEPDALYRYADAINRYDTTDLLYCDEDKFDGERYVEPYFKSDWNPDLLMCTNYVGNLLCIRKSLLKELAPHTAGADSVWMYDLTLRAGEAARNIYHERKVLFHTQKRAGSTPDANGSIKALQAHLDRLGIDATAAANEHVPGATEIQYHVPSENGPLVSILIPNKDLAPILERCLNSIASLTTYENYEVIVIENNSTETATFDLYRRVPSIDPRMRAVTYVPDTPGFSYAKVINYGARQAKGEYILTLNNDTEVITPDWIEQLLGPLTRDEVGAVGAKLLYPDDTIQHGGVSFLARNIGPCHEGVMEPSKSTRYHNLLQLSRNVPCVTGACQLVRRSLWNELGGLDERFAVDYNDADFCLRLGDTGKLVVYDPRVELHHYESLSRGDHDDGIQFCKDNGLLRYRWAKYYVQGDGYAGPHVYGPHHTLYIESA